MEVGNGPAQFLFLQALGHTRRCAAPAAVSLSAEASAHCRDRELLLAALRGSRAIERQSAAAAGMAVGMTYTPPHRGPCAPAVPRLPHPLSEFLGAAGELPRPPAAAPPGPATATVWAAALPPRLGAAHVGLNSAFSARGVAFNGASADAFADVGGLGIDCGANASPAGGVSAEVEVVATLDALRTSSASPTVSHKVAAAQLPLTAPLRHVTSLSMPVAGGSGVARVQLKRQPCGQDQPGVRRDVLCLELARRGSKRSDAGAGTPSQVGRLGAAGGASSSSSTSDSDGEECSARPGGAQLPELRLEVGRQQLRSDVALRWRQVWSGTLHSTAHLHALPGTVTLRVGSRPRPGLTVAGTLAVDAAAGDAAALQRASVKVVYRGHSVASHRHSLHLESCVARGGGGTAHEVKLRRRGSAAGGGGRMNLALKLHPRKRQVSLEFGCDILL